MKLTNLKSTLAWLVTATAAVPAIGHAQADAYPSKPITFIVPFPAGNVTDVLARTIAQGLSAKLGQSVIVENRPGAAGIIGTQQVANAKPDGYTMMYGSSGPIASHVSIYKKLPYDPLQSFAPVNGLSSNPLILVVNASTPYKTIEEFVEYMKKNPGKVSFGSPGVGTGAHLVGEQFQVKTDTRMTHVPYKDSSTLYSDLLSGRIDAVFDFVPVMRQNLAAGKVRVLAITRDTRAASLPAVPTLKERGYDMSFNTWSALLMPAGTSNEIVQKMSGAVRETMKSPEVVKFLEENESTSRATLGPNDLKAFITGEIAMYRDLVKKAGVTAE